MTVKTGYKRKKEQNVGRTKAGKLALSSCIGMVLLGGTLFLAAAICLHTDASGFLLPLAAYICCAVSAFPSGFFAAKAVGRSGLLFGLSASVPLCVLLLILCLTLHGTIGAGFLIGCILILFFGAFGGIAALNLRHRRRYR